MESNDHIPIPLPTSGLLKNQTSNTSVVAYSSLPSTTYCTQRVERTLKKKINRRESFPTSTACTDAHGF